MNRVVPLLTESVTSNFVILTLCIYNEAVICSTSPGTQGGRQSRDPLEACGQVDGARLDRDGDGVMGVARALQ